MIKHPLFTVHNDEPKRVEWRARKYCLIRTLSEDETTNAIYGIDPTIEVADGEVVVIYTEKYSTRNKSANREKRVIVPIREIVLAETWDYK